VYLAALLLGTSPAAAAPCPVSGGTVDIVLQPVSTAGPSTVLVFGTLEAAACDALNDSLTSGYAARLDCDARTPISCRTRVGALRPGRWAHRVLVTLGEATGQFQGRIGQVLDASAGFHTLEWPIYRSVHTVLGLGDSLTCSGCLRAAIAVAEASAKPALVQFAPDVLGNVVLTAPLPPLVSGRVTIDGVDTDGRPLTRGIDAAGMGAAALKIVSARNRVVGLRIANSGSDSDTLLIEGPEANGNVLDMLDVVGRSVEVCGDDDVIGCVLDGECHVPNPQVPRGECGDDAIAVRDFAGSIEPNIIRASTVRGARDKAVKTSEGGYAIVERSTVTGNTDGGLQATLSGRLTAIENVVASNRGTNSASGIAANGATVDGIEPARLETRGNLAVDNALRGISVRSLSIATLRDDFVCGNGTPGRGGGIGVAVLDAAGRSALATASGLGVVHNVDGGVVVSDTSVGGFGSAGAPGQNAFAFNGPALPTTPANFRNQTATSMTAAGNWWEHCGINQPCDAQAVQRFDVFSASSAATVAVDPAQATPQRVLPEITAIEPPFAAAGDLVRIYGSGFDAINGTGPDATCDAIADVNTCRPVRGNCVFIDQQPAAVVAVTPTMLVVRAPFSCVAPVSVRLRTRWSRGFARATFCTVPPAAS
jgi:hypothetical protein